MYILKKTVEVIRNDDSVRGGGEETLLYNACVDVLQPGG